MARKDGPSAVVIPFGAVALLALVALSLLGGDLTGGFGLGAVVGTLLLIPATMLAPWRRLAEGWRLVPAIAYLFVLSLIMDSAGDQGSVFISLLLLPVLWVSVQGDRRMLGLTLVGIALAMIVPLERHDFPMALTIRSLLVFSTAALIGAAIQNLVTESVGAERESRESQQTLAAITSAVRRATVSENARHAICEAVCDVSGATFAMLMERDLRGDLVSTGSAGQDLEARIIPGSEPSGAVVALNSGKRFFVADAVDSPAVSQRLVDRVGAASTLFEPVLAAEHDIVGVLIACWPARVDDQDDAAAEAVGLLAAEAAHIIERSDLVAKLANLARTDPLTGLLNRRSWDEGLAAERERTRRTGRSFAVLLVDLDGLKQVNDRAGHQAGDRLLKAAAASFRDACRRGDSLARIGGDEFALLLPESSMDTAAFLAERIRHGMPSGSSCSIGIAETGGDEPVEALVARADAALYRAKQAGGDHVMP